MEKYQIIRQRRLTKTPYLKLSNKCALITCVVGIAVAFIYNHYRSDEAVYVIRSGYYHDEEVQKNVTRMSMMSLFTMKKRDAMGERMKEEDDVCDISSRPLSIPEASVDY